MTNTLALAWLVMPAAVWLATYLTGAVLGLTDDAPGAWRDR